MITLIDILKDSNYNLSLFSQNDIEFLQSQITVKNNRPHVKCIIREKEVQLKPEEVVRQLYAAKLLNYYGYPKIESGLNMLSALAEKQN